MERIGKEVKRRLTDYIIMHLILYFHNICNKSSMLHTSL